MKGYINFSHNLLRVLRLPCAQWWWLPQYHYSAIQLSRCAVSSDPFRAQWHWFAISNIEAQTIWDLMIECVDSPLDCAVQLCLDEATHDFRWWIALRTSALILTPGFADHADTVWPKRMLWETTLDLPSLDLPSLNPSRAFNLHMFEGEREIRLDESLTCLEVSWCTSLQASDPK